MSILDTHAACFSRSQLLFVTGVGIAAVSASVLLIFRRECKFLFLPRETLSCVFSPACESRDYVRARTESKSHHRPCAVVRRKIQKPAGKRTAGRVLPDARGKFGWSRQRYIVIRVANASRGERAKPGHIDTVNWSTAWPTFLDDGAQSRKVGPSSRCGGMIS